REMLEVLGLVEMLKRGHYVIGGNIPQLNPSNTGAGISQQLTIGGKSDGFRCLTEVRMLTLKRGGIVHCDPPPTCAGQQLAVWTEFHSVQMPLRWQILIDAPCVQAP